MSAGSGRKRFRSKPRRPFVGLVSPGAAVLIILCGTVGHASPGLLFALFFACGVSGAKRTDRRRMLNDEPEVEDE